MHCRSRNASSPSSKSSMEPNHIEVGSAFNSLGLIRWRLGHHPEAETSFKRAIAIAEAAEIKDWTLGARLNNLALSLTGRGALR